MKKIYLALIFMWVLIIGLLAFSIIENRDISPNGFDISKKDFSNVKNYMEDNKLPFVTIVNMEKREIVTLYSTGK